MKRYNSASFPRIPSKHLHQATSQR